MSHSLLTRRNLLRLSGTAAATAVVGLSSPRLLTGPAVAASADPGGGTRPYLPYTPDSYYRSGVTGLAVDDTRTAAFRAFMKSHPDQKTAYPLLRGVGGNTWGTPYAVGTAADPVWKVRNLGYARTQNKWLQTTGFHAPEWLSTVLTGTSDSPLCVVDATAGVTVFLTKVSLAGPLLLDASSGGATWHTSNGLDYRNRASDDKRNFTSRGRISDAMVIRKDLVDWGVANDTDLGHVLHMFLVETNTADGCRSPMVGCESGKAGWGAEGERIAISPTVDLTRRGLSPEALVVARTLQRRGAYIGDNAGSGSALKCEQENAAHPVWGGRLTASSLQGITWDDFVVLR